MRKTNAIKARKAKARNFGLEAVAVRAMDCIVHTAARDSGLDMNGEELDALGWTPCGGAACAHHVHPRQRGGVGEGRFGLFSGCARHGDEAGEASPIKGPSSKRRAFEAKYGVNIIEVADAIALAHEPPLGIRGLAERWAAEFEAERSRPTPGPGFSLGLGTGTAIVVAEPLVGYDLAALMTWTRRRMAADTALDHTIHQDRYGLADLVAADLGLLDGDDWALCEQAGWPS